MCAFCGPTRESSYGRAARAGACGPCIFYSRDPAVACLGLSCVASLPPSDAGGQHPLNPHVDEPAIDRRATLAGEKDAKQREREQRKADKKSKENSGQQHHQSRAHSAPSPSSSVSAEMASLTRFITRR